MTEQMTIQSRKKNPLEAASNIVIIEVKFQDILNESPSTYKVQKDTMIKSGVMIKPT